MSRGGSVPGTPSAGREKGPGRGFRVVRDLPTVLWLVATVVVALMHTVLPAPRWLMIHLLLLGAVSHSILVWSRHFADALLRTGRRADDTRRQSVRLVMLNAGTVGVVTGVPGGSWPVTAAGAAAVATAVGWHGVTLGLRLRSALPARFATTVRYYVAAAAALPFGALVGTILARGGGDRSDARLLVTHITLNVLGWIGLTVLGTLVTLWPTMLRTRISPSAERAAARALPILLAGVAVAAASGLADLRVGAAAGLALYLIGLGLLAGPLVGEARGKPPSSFATWSVLAGLVWFVGSVAFTAIALGTAASWTQANGRLGAVTPALAAGFAAQVLLGALSYLLPVSLRGGPRAVRAASHALDRGGPLRLVLVNGGLLVALPPVPSPVRVIGALLVLGGFVAFLPLMAIAIRTSRRAKADGVIPTVGPGPGENARPRGQASGLAVVGLAIVALAVALGLVLSPGQAGRSAAIGTASAGVTPTGHTTQVEVIAAHMRFTPSRIEVPAGNRLVITVRNTDPTTVHDLVLDSGADSGRLAPGATGVVDAGVMGRDVDGWCSVVGHRQMGMVLQIVVLGGHPDGAGHDMEPAGPDGSSDAGAGGSAARSLDFQKAPDASFTAHPAQLPALTRSRVHRRTFTVSEVVREVSPGVRQRLWAYNGSVPGPILHGRVGDVFIITLINKASMGHSIDFHAGSLAPDQPMRTIPPGGSLVYTFTAGHAGIWMYHCSSMPMSAHIANGLFGAVVIDPPGLEPVADEYVLLQSELYLGAQDGPVDVDKVDREQPDAVVFNGYANQYDHRPLSGRVGERVRIWVLDAGPNRPTAFHVVGGQFDTVYMEGSYLLRPGSGSEDGGSQVLALAPAQGGFVELTLPEAGHYPFISHLMIDAERGAHGMIAVTR